MALFFLFQNKMKMKSNPIRIPVVAVVDAAHLLAGLQQVQDPRSAAALLLHLGVARLGLGFGLRVDVQRLLVRRVHGLIGRQTGDEAMPIVLLVIL